MSDGCRHVNKYNTLLFKTVQGANQISPFIASSLPIAIGASPKEKGQGRGNLVWAPVKLYIFPLFAARCTTETTNCGYAHYFLLKIT